MRIVAPPVVAQYTDSGAPSRSESGDSGAPSRSESADSDAPAAQSADSDTPGRSESADSDAAVVCGRLWRVVVGRDGDGRQGHHRHALPCRRPSPIRGAVGVSGAPLRRRGILGGCRRRLLRGARLFRGAARGGALRLGRARAGWRHRARLAAGRLRLEVRLLGDDEGGVDVSGAGGRTGARRLRRSRGAALRGGGAARLVTDRNVR